MSSLAGCSADTPTATGGPPPSAGAPSAEASPSPAGKYVTEIGSCLDVPYGQPYAVRTPALMRDCDDRHDAQIVGGGAFDAAGVTDEVLAAAYATCDGMARAFLKEDWRNGRLEIKVERPSPAAARSGERWWECLLIGDPFKKLESTLAHGLPADVRFTCAQVLGSGDDLALSDVDCATPHEAEFAGAVVMPVGTPFPRVRGPYPIRDACRKVVAAFVGVRTEQVTVHSQLMRSWEAWPGLRDVRCYAYFAPKKMTGSAKNTKGVGVPW
ncbi:septum formation family protein [Catellatospora sp. NPDC049111]|uniref:septum formation family protein n=1 Tax=Catellatospora sp. NPDC049111 TaxID=3155271 RepID=UPI003408C73C